MQKRIISWKAEAALFCDKKSEIVEYIKSKICDYQKKLEKQEKRNLKKKKREEKKIRKKNGE